MLKLSQINQRIWKNFVEAPLSAQKLLKIV